MLTQEGICLTLDPSFHFLEVAYPYVARRLLTDEDPALRERLVQVLFQVSSLHGIQHSFDLSFFAQDGKFQWKRLENLITLAKDGSGGMALNLNDTVKDALRLLILDGGIRRQIIEAFTEDDRLHLEEINSLMEVLSQNIAKKE